MKKKTYQIKATKKAYFNITVDGSLTTDDVYELIKQHQDEIEWDDTYYNVNNIIVEETDKKVENPIISR